MAMTVGQVTETLQSVQSALRAQANKLSAQIKTADGMLEMVPGDTPVTAVFVQSVMEPIYQVRSEIDAVLSGLSEAAGEATGVAPQPEAAQQPPPPASLPPHPATDAVGEVGTPAPAVGEPAPLADPGATIQIPGDHPAQATPDMPTGEIGGPARSAQPVVRQQPAPGLPPIPPLPGHQPQ